MPRYLESCFKILGISLIACTIPMKEGKAAPEQWYWGFNLGIARNDFYDELTPIIRRLLYGRGVSYVTDAFEYSR